MDKLRQQVGENFYDSHVYPSLLIIMQAIQEYPNSLALSYNGGKDSTVVFELVKILNPENLTLVYFEDSDTWDELRDFTMQNLQATRWPYRILPQPYKAGMQMAVNDGIQAVLMGTRSSDPSNPSQHFEPSSQGWPEFMRVYPIMSWSYSDIWYFIKSTNSSYCQLYNLGYTSLGPKSKTVPNPELINRPAWELIDFQSERYGRNDVKLTQN